MKLEHEIKQSSFNTPHEKLIINLIYTEGWVRGQMLDRFKPYQLTMQQYNVLRILRGQYPNPATVNLLVERMLDKTSNASRLVEKLRVKGLVERKTCKEDRRSVDVVITQAGLDLLAEIDQSYPQWEDRFHTLTNEEAELLSDLLDKLRG